MKFIGSLILLLLLVATGCKEPPAIDILIVDEETGLPIEGADVYIKKKLVGTSNEDGVVSIATQDRKNVFLNIEKFDYISRKFKADNLAMIDKVKMKPKLELSSREVNSSWANEDFEDVEYEDFLSLLESVDTASLPDGCDYHDGIYSREASFPGGTYGLQQFIVNTVQYPESAIDMDEQGKVYLSFKVTAEGDVLDIKIERGVSSSLDREAKRVLRRMPNWNPGYCNGRPVATRCRLPIVFTLN